MCVRCAAVAVACVAVVVYVSMPVGLRVAHGDRISPNVRGEREEPHGGYHHEEERDERYLLDV